MQIEETRVEIEETKEDFGVKCGKETDRETTPVGVGLGAEDGQQPIDIEQAAVEGGSIEQQVGVAGGEGGKQQPDQPGQGAQPKQTEGGEQQTEGGQGGESTDEQQGEQKQDQQQGEQDEHQQPKIDPSIFEKVMSGMTEDQKMEFLSNLPPCFDEDQIRRIAYAVFQQEYSGITEEINIMTERMINHMRNDSKKVMTDAKASADAMLDEVRKAIKAIGKPKMIEVKLEDGTVKKLGVVHKETEWLIKALKRPRNVFLSGPAGSGKTTCAEKVAEALGLSFHPISVGPETMKSDLLGFIDGNGNYHTTQVREAFEKGGLLLLDEIDAGNGASITILNALLANGYCSFPDGVIKKHPNFRCVAAANTFGRGSDRLYVGRNQLDAATLDRFVVRSFDYDESLERQLAGNDTWVDRVQEIRHKAEDLKLRVVVSPRASIIGAGMLEDGFSRKEVEEALIFKYDKEFRRKIEG